MAAQNSPNTQLATLESPVTEVATLDSSNTQVAEQNSPHTDVYLGLVFDYNGTKIPLEPKSAINDIKEKGLECGLPGGQRIAIGSLANGLKTLQADFGIDTSAVTDSDGNLAIPVPGLSNVFKQIMLAQLAVESFHLKIPGTAAPQGTPTLYTLGLSATWPQGTGDLIPGMHLQLLGIYFKVSNEGEPDKIK